MIPPDTLAPAPATPAPLLPLDALASLLAAPARWLILQELAKGEPLPVNVLAQRTGTTASAASKNLTLMRRLGVVHSGYGRLYTLTPPFRPAPGSHSISLGPCTLHFDSPLLQ